MEQPEIHGCQHPLLTLDLAKNIIEKSDGWLCETDACDIEDEEAELQTKIGFDRTYSFERRNDYRNYIQHLLAQFETPHLKEKQIADELVAIIKGNFAPFIGIGGIPGAGKSYLCENLV